MTFEELLGKIEELVAKFEMPATDAAAIIFSHWTYSMEQTRLDIQVSNTSGLKEVLETQRELLKSLDEGNTTGGRSTKPWMP